MRSAGKSSVGAVRKLVKQLLVGLAFSLAALLGIAVQSAAAAPPTATIESVIPGYTTAKVSGKIDPEDQEVAVYIEARRPGTGELWLYEFIGSVEAGKGPTSVSGEIGVQERSRLAPATEYEFRLNAYVPPEEYVSTEPNPTATTKAVPPPTVTLGAPSALTESSAHFSGLIDPNAPEAAPASADVEMAFEVRWHFECTPECPGLVGGTVPADDTSHSVEADASGLSPGTAYEVELVTENISNKTSAGSDAFTTLALPPTVGEPSASDVSGTEATLGVFVDPGGAPTTYHFEYVAQAQYEAQGGFTGPATLSTAPSPLGFSDDEAHPADAKIIGLIPGTTYYFRVAATNTSPGEPVVYSQPQTLFTYPGGGEPPLQDCADEVLRSENGSLNLPDCRVYEKVTPAAKNGAQFGSVALADGPRVAFSNFVTFGGAEIDNLIGTGYEISRSETGWATRALGGPATQFEGTNEVTPLATLGADGTNLLGLRPRGTPVDGENLYLRRGGSLTEIGPEAPAATLVGLPNQESLSIDQSNQYFSYRVGSADLSHVVFQLAAPVSSGDHSYLWPFDPTETGSTAAGAAPSTYEYAGTGNSKPFLVGVAGGPGSTDLIGGCGTSVGSLRSQDVYNAISADGRVVFFTPWGEDVAGPCGSPGGAPATSELYARIDGETPAAHTVEISEPSQEDCESCQTTETQTELKDAVFQGASEDGSKVFFLTEQELLPGNPGQNLYEYDLNGPAGQKVTAVSHLASNAEAGVLGVTRVSADGSHVYFVAEAALTPELNSTGARAEAGRPDLYVYDTDSRAVRFVATLSPGDSGLWDAEDDGRPAQATPDGRFLLFTSVARLTPDDTSTVSQLFRYDAATGQLIRISVGQNGFNNDGNTATDPVKLKGTYFTEYSGAQRAPSRLMISNDGSYVFFESTDGLTPKALYHVELPNHVGLFAENVYEWHEGQIKLISDGRDRTYLGETDPGDQVSSVRLVGTTPSGRDVLFTTSDPLMPTDTDEGQDIYDARVDGGFPAGSSSACAEESCQGRPTAVSPTPQAGTAGFNGPVDAKKHHRKHHKKHHRKHHRKHHKKPHHRKNRRGGSPGKRADR